MTAHHFARHVPHLSAIPSNPAEPYLHEIPHFLGFPNAAAEPQTGHQLVTGEPSQLSRGTGCFLHMPGLRSQMRLMTHDGFDAALVTRANLLISQLATETPWKVD